MTPNIPQAVRHVITEYRRYLKTTYRFLDLDLRRQFEEHLETVDVLVKGPYVTLARDYERGQTLEALIQGGLAEPELGKAHWAFGKNALFSHQERGLRAGSDGKSFLVTSGTGSGKTEAFMLPVFNGILRRKKQGIKGVQAVFLYPMNALANDQLERLRRLLRGSGLDISFGLYTGDSDNVGKHLREEPAESERTSRALIRKSPPDIILTNYKQLEFLLVREEDRGLFTPSLKYLVLDEMHSYRGALATEMACLIRRLKAHAGLKPGEVVPIGTSATVATGATGLSDLARFATDLFGEKFAPASIIEEVFSPRAISATGWTPGTPSLDSAELATIDTGDESVGLRLAKTLTGKTPPPGNHLSERLAAVMDGNRFVEVLEDLFSSPRSLSKAVEEIGKRLPERAGVKPEALRLEIEAYLILGSLTDSEDFPPRLRPKLHTFFHGVYDVWLCVNPDCRKLIPQGGGECPHCGHKALPAALCRTCGQDFVKARPVTGAEGLLQGDADYFSDTLTHFLTPKIHDLAGSENSSEDSEGGENAPEKRPRGRRGSKDEKLAPGGLCTTCLRFSPNPGGNCPYCHVPFATYQYHLGKLNTCPACGDIYTRGDIVTPLRTGTASSVAVLSERHLDHLKDEDRKLLIFADNRQDAAHHAGYAEDKNRQFAVRHAIAWEIRGAKGGVDLSSLPQGLFDRLQKLGRIPRRLNQSQQNLWIQTLTYECAQEFSGRARQRASLEQLGLVALDYGRLEDLGRDPAFQAAAKAANLSQDKALLLVRAILDILRKNRALDYDFFQRYIDPSKRPFREMQDLGVTFSDYEKNPKAVALDRPEAIRKAHSGSVMGIVRESPKGRPPGPHTLAKRLIGTNEGSEDFLRALFPLLIKEEIGLLIAVPVPPFPLKSKDMPRGFHVYQVNHQALCLSQPEKGFRCSACRVWRAYDFVQCPTPRCESGRLVEESLDQENYYVHLYHSEPPLPLNVKEHSAQISDEERARRETDFKDGKIQVLVSTPTLELGVDIGPLLSVVLRKAPPTAANYIQRVGRAGRRLRIGFASTFCTGGPHDRHAFENPEWFVRGQFRPPQVRLDNILVVNRHLRSFLLESLRAQLKGSMGEYLDDKVHPTRWMPEYLDPLVQEASSRRPELVGRMASLFEPDRQNGRTILYGSEDCQALAVNFEKDLHRVYEGWWGRVRQLNKEFDDYSKIGAPTQDDKKARARKRAYKELTDDPQRAYTLNYLSTQQLLPAYQFPLDTFSLDPGVDDPGTKTLYRPSALAIEEFAPGNFVYVNGKKLKSIRVLYSGSSKRPELRGSGGAEASGRVVALAVCPACEEAHEAGRNACQRCGTALTTSENALFVDAFEAEENQEIGAWEESRQLTYFDRRETLYAEGSSKGLFFDYQPCTPLELKSLAKILITNRGPSRVKGAEGRKFEICLDCGRHRSGLAENPTPSQTETYNRWQDNHRRFCSGPVEPVILGHLFQSDALIFTIPAPFAYSDGKTKPREDSLLVTLAESLLAGATSLLELEPFELQGFPRRSPAGADFGEIVFYENVPGGAGYLEEMARRLPEVAQAARERLFNHDCGGACYLCLKHYRNQLWHSRLDKNMVRDFLLTLSSMDKVEPTELIATDRLKSYQASLQTRRQDLASQGRLPGTGQGTESPIELKLLEALKQVPGLPLPVPQYTISGPSGPITRADFAYPDKKIAIFCDGFAFHGNPSTLELDSIKRNSILALGWRPLVFWGHTILRDPESCAQDILQQYSNASGMGRPLHA